MAPAQAARPLEPAGARAGAGGRPAGAGGLRERAGAGPGRVVASRPHRALGLRLEHRAAGARGRARGGGARGRRRLAGQHVPVPRAKPVRVGAPAAVRRTDLHHRLHLYRSLAVRGPDPERAARGHGLGACRLLVPADPLAGRRDRGHDAGALPLRLSARARRLPRAVHLHARRQPHPRPRPLEQLPRGRRAARPPGDRRRRGLGPDGGPGRFRHRPVFRGQHLHDRHLSHLVRARPAGRRGPAGSRADAGRAARAGGRALVAGPRALSAHRPVAAAPQLRSARRLGGARMSRPARCRSFWASACRSWTSR